MDIKNKKILVTGAGGFIGSHLVGKLLKGGGIVRAMVKYNSRNDAGMLNTLLSTNNNSIEVIYGDVRDPFFVRESVTGCDYVFHLAALIGIPYSYVSPQEYITTNIQGTLNILQACRSEGTTQVVHTSTSETYGTAQYVPIDENHPLQGQSPYSASKIGADKLVESFFKSFDLPVVTIRPFNTFGPRQSLRAFIPTVIHQALTMDKIKIGSLKPVRDLTFVNDTVDGFIQIGLNQDALGKVINLGTGKGYEIGDVVNFILKILDKENMIIEADSSRIRPKKSEVMKLISNNTLARNQYGWEPKYSLEDGLKETIKWINDNLTNFDSSRYYV